MTMYEVKYYFNGYGKQTVEAKSKKEAEEKFEDGDTLEEEEWGEEYCVDEINEIPDVIE